MPSNDPVQVSRTDTNFGGIPVTIWGDPSPDVIVAVHGLFSSRLDPVIETLAAVSSCQIISFDLPNHGSRKADLPSPLWPPDAMHDIACVMKWAFEGWADVSLFAVSIGAYFSLLACPKMALSQVWFLSPLTDMPALIQASMNAAGVSAERLEQLGTVNTSEGEVLSWDYYSFAVANAPTEWPNPTFILHGTSDNVAPLESSQAFANQFGASITVLPDGEHWFHTPQQLEQLSNWIKETSIRR